jgi:hypothetical protein
MYFLVALKSLPGALTLNFLLRLNYYKVVKLI